MTWQTEFDEKLSRYIKNISVGQYDDAGVNIGFEKAKNIIKAFIQDLLDRKEREIEGLRKESGNETWTIDAYNQALDQAISILKEE